MKVNCGLRVPGSPSHEANEEISMKWKKLALARVIATTVAIALACSAALAADGPWPVEKARAWGEAHPWLVGCNYCPSTAINQLEMWQADTFDPATIDRELGWAQELGFNSMRVFLHDLAYMQDPE